jgi:hypothetical protein
MRHIRCAGLAVVLALAAAILLPGLAAATGLATAAGGATAIAAVEPATIGVTPSTAAPGSAVTFSILCGDPSGSAALVGTVLGLPGQIPMTRQSRAGEWTVWVTLPAALQPGTYTPSLNCDNGVSGTTTLVVVPSGAPVTGDGTTTTATGGHLTTAGLSLVGLGALAVLIWALRSRVRPRSGD